MWVKMLTFSILKHIIFLSKHNGISSLCKSTPKPLQLDSICINYNIINYNINDMAKLYIPKKIKLQYAEKFISMHPNTLKIKHKIVKFLEERHFTKCFRFFPSNHFSGDYVWLCAVCVHYNPFSGDYKWLYLTYQKALLFK